MRVVVDTNAFESNGFKLDTGQWKVVLREAREYSFRLVVPEVVVVETVGRFRRRSQDAITKLAKARSDFARLPAWQVLPKPTLNLDATVAGFEIDLRAQLTSAHAVIAAIPNVDHAVLVERAARRTKPFAGEEGAGYRDALIWENVLEQAAHEEVAFVTKNWRDFAASDAGDRLHDDLATECAARGVPVDRVRLFPDLPGFIDEYVTTVAGAKDQLDLLLAGDEQVRGGLESLLDRALNDSGPLDVLGLPEWFENPTVDNLEGYEDIELRSARRLTQDSFLIVGQLTASASIDGYIYKADWYALSEEEEALFSVQDGDWNEHYLWVGAEQPVVVEFELTFTPPHGLSDVAILEVRTDS